MRDYLLNEIALRIHKISAKKWGEKKALVLIGRHGNILETLRRLVKYAHSGLPLLITGESGVGKEIFARSLYILSRRSEKPFISLNCAQYQDENLLVSELFGHRKGSFTGAMADHSGIFEKYTGGVVFLDEVGELSLKAQGMLLRVLAEGEIKPLGQTSVKSVDVQVIAATNRDLKKQIAEGTFREDLYYRLCRLHLQIPPLRERGNDWKLLVDYNLNRLNREFELRNHFCEDALDILATYDWPGNVRELINIVNIGFFLCEDGIIQPADFNNELRKKRSQQSTIGQYSNGFGTAKLNDNQSGDMESSISYSPKKYLEKIQEGEDFWQAIHKPYLDRELNRSQVRAIVRSGLEEAGGSYKKLLNVFNLSESHYLKFMDFLRHHRLKPERLSR